ERSASAPRLLYGEHAGASGYHSCLWHDRRPAASRFEAAHDRHPRYRRRRRGAVETRLSAKADARAAGPARPHHDGSGGHYRESIGKPDLGYVQLPEEQVRAAMTQMGMSLDMANLILEMAAALNSGYMRALEPRSPRNTTPTSFEIFVAEVFVPVYQGRARAA